MPLSASDILGRIEKGAELPTVAPVMRRLLALKPGDESQLLEITRIDPAIAARILRAANSSAEYETPVSDLKDAFDRLGSQNARHIALTTRFPDDQANAREDDPALHLQWLWERSICVAVAAETFAREIGLPEPQRYHQNGLMMDVGLLFLLWAFPVEYGALLERWRMEGGALAEIEEDVLGVNHKVVGHQLARVWALGADVEAAALLASDSELPIERGLNLDLLRLADMAAGVLFEEHHITGLERAIRFAGDRFQVERQTFIDALQRITLVADSASFRLSLDSGQSTTYIDLLKTINEELGRATLSYEQMVRELEQTMRKAESLALKLEEANRRLRDAANIDPLTKVYNRRYFEEFFGWNFNRAKRYDTTLGCMMIDIDHFKRVNDTYGHLAGDHILQEVAETLRINLRNTDIVARYGGEEFVVLLPETRPDTVKIAAVKLNEAVRKRTFTLPDATIGITVSIGYLAYTPSVMPDAQEPAELVRIADQNMYQAKENGRNRVWPPPEGESKPA